MKSLFRYITGTKWLSGKNNLIYTITVPPEEKIYLICDPTQTTSRWDTEYFLEEFTRST